MAWNLSDPDQDALIGWDDSEGDVIVYTLGDGIQSTGTVLSTTLVDAADIRGLGFFDITNDGTGSGLDADLLDGNEATAFVTLSGAQTITGAKTFNDNVSAIFGTGGDASIKYDATNLVISPADVGTGDVHISGAGIILDDTEKITLDGTSGNDTIHSQGNQVRITVAGTETIKFSNSGAFLTQGNKLGLDGSPAGDTYIRSGTNNRVEIVTGGTVSIDLAADEVTFTGTLKNTTGDPTGVEGRLTINTFDNAIKVYADGAWRTLASW